MKQSSPVTVYRIRDVTGLDAQQIWNALGGMKKAGQLLVTGVSRNKLYQMVKPDKPSKPPKQAAWSMSGKWQPPARKRPAEIIYPPGTDTP